MIRTLVIAVLFCITMPAIAFADGCIDAKLYQALLLRMGYTPQAMTQDDDGRLEIWTGANGVLIVGIANGKACWRGRHEKWHFAKRREA